MVSSAEAQAQPAQVSADLGREAEVDAANYTTAIFNILDDLGDERLRLESTQRAILNILDDVDIERRKVEDANLDLQEINETMRGFIAVAAHDLRSPLASMVGFSSLLTENWATLTEANRWKFVTTIDRQSHNLSRLVDDLLTLSSIDGGSMNVRPENIVLADAIARCLESSDGDVASISVFCAPDLVVRADPDHLRRILDNYVQNSFKYGKPPVRIEAIRVDDMVEARVLDNGPGVPVDFVPRLFGKFARANAPNTRDQKGTGLGLSIVRGLAEVNGGRAFYEPNIPNGSSFVVRLRSGGAMDS